LEGKVENHTGAESGPVDFRKRVKIRGKAKIPREKDEIRKTETLVGNFAGGKFGYEKTIPFRRKKEWVEIQKK